MSTHYVYVRANPGASARRDPVYHNALCPKLARKDIASSQYKQVATPPSGYRPCRMCGG